MRNLWFFFFVGLTTAFIGEKLVLSQITPAVDDLYMEGQPSGDLPVDDEDGEDDGSGSGSGDYVLSDETEVLRMLPEIFKTTSTKNNEPSGTQSTTESHRSQTTTAETFVETTFDEHNLYPQMTDTPPMEDGASPSSIPDDVTEVYRDEDKTQKPLEKSYGKPEEGIKPEQVTSWERTGVLAAVIACGVVGFVCAVFLLLLLAYRMKKKDEGSYDLGDTKLSATVYHKAPTKEFYA